MPVLAELDVADDPGAWAAAGFTVGDDGECVIGHVRIRLAAQQGKSGVTGWALDGLEADGDIDDLPTRPPAHGVAEPWEHPNGSLQLDHLVVATPDLARTAGALERAGFVARRTRDAGPTMQQVFFRMGEVILELVGPRDTAGDGPAAFYGLAINVADLDATKSLLGDRVTDPKDAVQTGRRIATLKTRDLGITTAIAYMTP